jgi:signal transduction histidine kinase
MRSLRARVNVLVVGFALTLLALALVAVWAIRELDRTQDRLVSRVGVARVAAKDLEVALLDQETAVRGFALSGDDEFLEPGIAGLDEEQAASEEIRNALGSTPSVVAALDDVSAAGQAWRDEVAEPAARLVIAGQAAEAVVRLEEGKASFDAVRADVADLNDVLFDVRADAVDDIDRARTVLWAVAGGTGLVLLAGGVIVTVALRRSVLRPLDELGEDARIVTAGDFEHRIERVGPQEISELAEMIELMRTRITLELEEVRRAREDVAAQAQELERSNRDLEQFAYVASHDLQEPLRKVAGFCQLLQRRYGGTLDERADEYIYYAVDGAERMQDLISDLLSFSRVGRTTERFEPVDLGEVVDAAWAQLDLPDGARMAVSGELPVIAGDRALLSALFANLFGNSMKFAGEDPPQVAVATRRVDDVWHISVSDNGIGVPAEFADRIFVIFQRLHTRDAYEGTGIGLALGKRIVEFHGGSIVLGESEAGARFDITFPALTDPDAIGRPPEAIVPYRPEGMLT